VTGFVSPLPPAPPAEPSFGVCVCGAPIYQHGRYNTDGNIIYAGCASTGCTTYRASDGSGWPNNYGGATLDDPADLHVNTDHWVDGRVVLSGETR
jgi:hypothetical protein